MCYKKTNIIKRIKGLLCKCLLEKFSENYFPEGIFNATYIIQIFTKFFRFFFFFKFRKVFSSKTKGNRLMIYFFYFKLLAFLFLDVQKIKSKCGKILLSVQVCFILGYNALGYISFRIIMENNSKFSSSKTLAGYFFLVYI